MHQQTTDLQEIEDELDAPDPAEIAASIIAQHCDELESRGFSKLAIADALAHVLCISDMEITAGHAPSGWVM
jgi:hypothetical protein